MLTKFVDKNSASAIKRSARCIMTDEARVLREMRLQYGYTMRKAGELLGLSDSYIAHLETGRVDLPKGEKLERILAIYGGIKVKSFNEKVRNFRQVFTPRDELNELLNRVNETQVQMILTVAKGLIGIPEKTNAHRDV